MTNFTFSSTAECELCGAYLNSSDEDCRHGGRKVNTYVFRRMNEGRESLKGVKSIAPYKWHKLEKKVGDDWIAYHFLGSKQRVNSMLQTSSWDSVEDLPTVSTSLDSPSDVGENA